MLTKVLLTFEVLVLGFASLQKIVFRSEAVDWVAQQHKVVIAVPWVLLPHRQVILKANPEELLNCGSAILWNVLEVAEPVRAAVKELNTAAAPSLCVGRP